MARVLLFGTFDPLHDGHRWLFEQAAALGEQVTVVVARDSYIRARKGRAPRAGEAARRQAVAEEPPVSEALLGDDWPNEEPLRLLRELEFDVLVLGHDQTPSEDDIRQQLRAYGKGDVHVVRLPRSPDTAP